MLELGGNDPAIIAPDVEVTEELAAGFSMPPSSRAAKCAWRSSASTFPAASVGAFVEALNAGLSSAVVGDGLEPEVTMGPVHRPEGRDFVERLLAEADRPGVRVHRPATVRAEDADQGGYIVSPAIVEDPPPDLGHRPRGAVRAGATRDRVRRHLGCGRRRQRHRLRALRLDLERGRGARASVSARLEAGTVFVNQHGMSAIDYRAPMGGWKRSGYGLELGIEGMQAFTRTRVVLCRTSAGIARQIATG